MRHQRGFALIATAVCAVTIVAMLGLAVDAGRLYITKNESQIYADAAAVSAALALDESADGLAAARRAVAASPNKWDMGTESFTGTLTEFASGATPDSLAPDNSTWTAAPAGSAGYRFVRVTATVKALPLYFITVVGAKDSAKVVAQSVAGRRPKNGGYAVWLVE